VRYSVLVAALVLGALTAAAAGARDAAAPEGAWYLDTTRAAYSGPPLPVRALVTKAIERRISFTSTCPAGVCATSVHVMQIRPRREVVFRLIPNAAGDYSGRVTMRTSMRCGSRPVKMTFAITARVEQTEREPRLVGSTDARAVNPGGCRAFRGMARAVRKTTFVGSRLP
jgi:hypothetical protein